MKLKKYLNKANALKSLKLRARAVKNGYSLYIDTTEQDNRQRITLNIKIKDVNDPLLSYAVALRDRKELEMLQEGNGFRLYRSKIKLKDYFKQEGTTANRDSALRYLEQSYIGSVSIGEISTSDCEAFKNYLLEQVSPSTAKLYFQLVKTAFNKAVRDQKIRVNPCNGIKIKAESKKKEFLTINELKILGKIECKNEEVKRAFLFSCVSGLRYSDLCNIRKSDISDQILTLKQKKTKEVIYIPLSIDALRIVNMNDSEQIFNLPSLKRSLEILEDWTNCLNKKVTFHVGRVTFAYLCLSSGVGVYHLSKLLGHKSLRSTEVYARLANQDMQDAVAMLPSL